MLRAVAEIAGFGATMLLLAAVVFGAFALVIFGGNYAVYLWYDVLRHGLGLPHPIALALTVMASALTVYGVFWWLAERPNRRRPRTS